MGPKASGTTGNEDDEDDRSRDEEEAAAELLQLAGGSPRAAGSGSDAGSGAGTNNNSEANMPALPGSINIHVPTSSAATHGGSSMAAATAVPTIISQQQLQQIQQSQVLQLQQKLAQEEAVRQQQQQQLQHQLQVQQLQGLQGVDPATLQQLIQGGALLGNTNTNINTSAIQQPPNASTNSLLGALLANQPQQPQASQSQLQPLDTLLLQHAQAQQLQALQSQMGGPLVSPQIQQLQLQLQIAQAQQAQAQQAQAQAQAQTQLQVHNLLGSVLGGTAAPPAQPNSCLPANIDVASLAAALHANTSGTINNPVTASAAATNIAATPNAVPAGVSAAEIVDWMKKSAPEAFQKLCQDAGLNPVGPTEPGSPATAKV